MLSSSAPGACKLVGSFSTGPAWSARWEFNKELSQDRITTDPITHSHHCDPKMMPALHTHEKQATLQWSLQREANMKSAVGSHQKGLQPRVFFITFIQNYVKSVLGKEGPEAYIHHSFIQRRIPSVSL